MISAAGTQAVVMLEKGSVSFPGGIILSDAIQAELHTALMVPLVICLLCNVACVTLSKLRGRK